MKTKIPLKQLPKRILIRAIRLALLFYIISFIIAGCCSNSLIFHPPACSYPNDKNIISIPVKDGRTISAMYFPAEGARFTILFSHGNAEDIGQNKFFFKLLNQRGFSVLAYDYAGYGKSEGKPTEQNTCSDIEAAYDYLIQQQKIPAEQIILHGRSVGTGPTVALAAKKPAAGMILESPFLSAFRVLTRVKILPFDKYQNLQKIKQVSCPILIIHGTKDQVVAFWHGQKLYEAANPPKMFYQVENAGHNNLLYKAGEEYFRKLNEFTSLIEKQ